ncbi:hypothetical protein SCHPADRAFT_555343 [Schizopora paradoxa]|uniref:Uncharacterized protein n=1 Tax=Schizopora paradoxa TaxID=27342 RepID=A0A0H2RD12_9AGAM|nr:hypothetical protein SCHPADRAFT_555343 [Schizopora paradoxa]
MHERAKAALEKAKAGGEVSNVAPEDVERLVNSLGDGAKEENCEDILKILMGSTRTAQQKSPPSPKTSTAPHICPYKSALNGSASNSQSANPSEVPLPTAPSTGDSIFFTGGTSSGATSFTGPIGVMPESSTATTTPSLLGPNGSLPQDKTSPQQTSADSWPSVMSAGDYDNAIMQDILSMELPGWQNHLRQDLSSSSGSQPTQTQSNPMNAANAQNGRPEVPYFPFGGIDFSNVDHLNLISGFSSSSLAGQSTSQGVSASGAPSANNNSYLPMDPSQFSEFTQGSASLPEIGSSLPLIDGDTGPSDQRVGDTWQSFVSESGFQTADELMRSWQVY